MRSISLGSSALSKRSLKLSYATANAGTFRMFPPDLVHISTKVMSKSTLKIFFKIKCCNGTTNAERMLKLSKFIVCEKDDTFIPVKDITAHLTIAGEKVEIIQ